MSYLLLAISIITCSAAVIELSNNNSKQNNSAQNNDLVEKIEKAKKDLNLIDPSKEQQELFDAMLQQCEFTKPIVLLQDPNASNQTRTMLISSNENPLPVIIISSANGTVYPSDIFDLYHELGHVVNGDLEKLDDNDAAAWIIREKNADLYSIQKLIELENYEPLIDVCLCLLTNIANGKENFNDERHFPHPSYKERVEQIVAQLKKHNIDLDAVPFDGKAFYDTSSLQAQFSNLRKEILHC